MLLTGVRNISKIDSGEEVNYEEMLKAPTTEEIIQLMEGKTWSEINGKNEENEVA